MRLTAAERDTIWQRDRGRCIWPHCAAPAAEVAHFHSRGAGGRISANTPSNMGLLCWDHARISDGEYGSGGREQYEQAHRDLLGPEAITAAGLAWARAEALVALIYRASLQ